MPRAQLLTGRLLTVFTQDAVEWVRNAAGKGTTDFTDLSQYDGPGRDQLQRVLQKYSTPTLRAVRSLSIPEIMDLDRVAQGGPFPPSQSLLAYWIVGSALDDKEAELTSLSPELAALSAELSRIKEVFKSVYSEEAVGEPPNVNWQNDKYARDQFYLDKAPDGIDAKWAWQQGVDGAGIGFADVEMGWNRLHQDLKSKMPPALLTHQDNPQFLNHGTGVLGIVVGSDDAKGIVGIAPGVTSVLLASHWDGASRDNVADAIATAAARLKPGDVLLLETQKGPSDPIELMAGGAEMTAIQAAASKGIIVIEAAGNAGRSLDPDFPASRADSGAIMVGASVGDDPPASMGVGSHARFGSSNFGARVDCFAPGVGLVTAGGGDLDDGGDGGGAANRTYSAAFRATSGASAILAGAAILAQHMNVTATGTRLNALQMRTLLTQNGRRQGAQDGNIGVMPDLRRISGRLLVPA
jgi:serine protease